MVLSDSEFESWLSDQRPPQAATSMALRAKLLHGAPSLREAVHTGRWLNGYIFYTAEPGTMVYALGAVGRQSIAFHAMPWYGSPELRARYGATMKPFVAGKSCFHFPTPDALPHAALEGIIDATGSFLATVDEMSRRRR
jgi:hypothetical protein